MIHTVMYGKFKLEIDDDGVLCSMSNSGGRCNADIPKILPTGEEIKNSERNF
ncbi:MAG: hypothetical protein NC452_21545 [Eubacterium sp.]|nr:hypothetical protein [Eubacterium sp.]